MRAIIATSCALALIGLSGCATIVSGTHSTTYFETTPETARCELVGRKFNEIVNTPGSLSLPASAAPIQVTCESNGYRPGTAKLDTSANGWAAGNILFGLLGGRIGLLVDAASGAGQDYPPKLSIVLEPERFSSVAERDKWYAEREVAVKASWQQVIDEKIQHCRQVSYSSNDIASANCKAGVKAFEGEREEEIKQLEEGRLAAQIGTVQTIETPPLQNPSPAGNQQVPPPASSIKTASSGGPVDVPFKLDIGTEIIEGTGKLENGHLTGQASLGGRPITISGDMHGKDLAIEVDGSFAPPTYSSYHSTYYCTARASAQTTSGNLAIPLNAVCGGDNFQDTLYLDMPTTSS